MEGGTEGGRERKRQTDRQTDKTRQDKTRQRKPVSQVVVAHTFYSSTPEAEARRSLS